MNKNKKIIVALVVIGIIFGGYYFLKSSKKKVKQININEKPQLESAKPVNNGHVSPLSGLACADWNRRPIAVMQPSDLSARPDAGLSSADMVFEMPVVTASITRLMAVYVCGNPTDLGSMRSARHDYIALAKGLDAIFVHWGGSHYALDKLKEGVIDDMNCNNDGGRSAQKYCYRKSLAVLAKDRAFPKVRLKGDDTGYAKFSRLLEGAKAFKYNMIDKFSGYPHQEEAPLNQRPKGGTLSVNFAKPYNVKYTYDKKSNSYLRTWGGVIDTDRDNKKQLAPKNVVVMFAKSAQMIKGIQYNNVQLGDPWYDTSDSGSAHYYINGKTYTGTWKKDKSRLDSKLYFYDDAGQQFKFVPGQIWVEILEPGQGLHWTVQN